MIYGRLKRYRGNRPPEDRWFLVTRNRFETERKAKNWLKRVKANTDNVEFLIKELA